MSATSLLRPLVPVLLLALAGCAPLFTKDEAPENAVIESIGGAPEQAPPVSKPPVAGCPDGGCVQVPRQRNLTGQPALLLAGESSAGAYWSFGLKTTYSFDAQGRLTLLTGEDAEPMIDHATPADGAEECRAWGSAYNQRTT